MGLQDKHYTGAHKKQDNRLAATRYNTIINNIVNVQGQDIVERSRTRRCQRGTQNPLGIRGHCEENRDDRINRKISNFTAMLVQRKGQHADEVLLAEKEGLFRGIVDQNWKDLLLSQLLTS